MIMPGADIKVLVATKPVDFRKQADSLAALVQEALAADPFCGTSYVFRSPCQRQARKRACFQHDARRPRQALVVGRDRHLPVGETARRRSRAACCCARRWASWAACAWALSCPSAA